MAPDSYAWWYFDALSDDGRYAIVIIAMLGAAFSPHYARARAARPTDPLDHVTINVALYGPNGRRWALTERSGATRHHDSLTIGASTVRVERDGVTIAIDEHTTPWPGRLKGVVRFDPSFVARTSWSLDANADHQWWPIAPRARVTVELDEPALSFRGVGYMDANAGNEPLEKAFSAWNWCRIPTSSGALVSYAVLRRDGSLSTFDKSFSKSGANEASEDLSTWDLDRTAWWRLPRSVRAARHGAQPRLIETLENGPFYSRSTVALTHENERATGFHESLSLDRFTQSWVRSLLPMRIRRG